jgi:hypothetical protein
METKYNMDKSGRSIPRFFKYILYALGGLALAGGLAIIFGYFVMLLWNWLMPGIFGLVTITFWQAVGIIILARIFFGNFKRKHHDSFRKPWFKHRSYQCGSKGKHSWKNWRHYESFWEEEGEPAFQKYVERKSTVKENGEV